MQKKMVLFIVILGTSILIVGMILAIRAMRPVEFNIIAGIIALIGTLFLVFGKHKQDLNSSKNMENLKNQVNNLQSEISKKDSALIDLGQQNIELGKMNVSLSNRLSEKSTEIYDLSKKIKYPLPETAKTSIEFYLKLDEEAQKKADVVLSKLNLTHDEKHYDLIDYNAVRAFIGLGSITIYFSKKITVSKQKLWFSREYLNLEGSLHNVSRLNYNSALKVFFVSVDNLPLRRQEWFDSNLSSNVVPNSILDLANCSVTVSVSSPYSEISEFKLLRIVSPELNLTFQDLERWPGIDGNIFICSRKLKI